LKTHGRLEKKIKRIRILPHSADNFKNREQEIYNIKPKSRKGNIVIMAKLTVAAAKKQIIKQIKKHGGLFENCGQKEIRQLKDQIENKFFLWDEKCEELQLWIESLDSSTIQQYL